MQKLLLVFMAISSTVYAETKNPAKPHYVMTRGGQYGYEVPLSEAQIRNGIAAKSMLMVSYRGIVNGRQTIEAEAPHGIVRISCEMPCDYLDEENFGDAYRHDVIKNDIKNMAGLIMHDAIAGFLTVSSD